MRKINVTKSYLPPIEEYIEKIKVIWENHYLTNFGPLHNELEDRLRKYLDVENLHYVNNGTMSIQIAIESLGLEKGEIITTPFTFIASSSSIVWENFKPVFVDIEPNHFGIDTSKIEAKINKNTRAILAVHCFGFPCDVKKIEEIAKKHKLPVIYDAAHTFGVKYKGKSLYKYGDISCSSLHSTKVFHSVEGGLIIVNNKKYNNRVNAFKNFGYEDGTYNYVGINAKNSEFHSAMGLCVLDHFNEILKKRKKVYEEYTKQLNGFVEIPTIPKDVEYNYIYYPVLFKNEKQLLKVLDSLNNNNIAARRYFYPSLNKLKIFGKDQKCPVSEDITSRIACLPMDTYLEKEEIKEICRIIKESL